MKKYDIDNLFLAVVNVYVNGVATNGYCTIMAREKECNKDLLYNRKLITYEKENGISYKIEYIKSLKSYYDGKNKLFTRKESLVELKNNYDLFYKEFLDNYETLVIQK